MKNYIKKNYHLLVPILVTLLLYSISLTFDFRNFDEDGLIKNFYTPKTFSEYVQKFLLVNFGGASDASGFSFSSIRNNHVSIFGIPLFYLIIFLFKGSPLLFHLWSLFLHLIAVVCVSLFIYELTNKKEFALLSSLVWTIHPINVEPVIWATNWAHLLGAGFYFFTLYKLCFYLNRCEITLKNIISVNLLVLIQIMFTEHTITIPFGIFFTSIYKTLSTKNLNFSLAYKIPLPSFLIMFSYWVFRNLFISKALNSSLTFSFSQSIERILILCPQIFLHHLKLIFFPKVLSIDQIDLININSQPNYLISLVTIFVFLSVIFLSFKKNKLISYSLLMCILCLLPFIQIIPLYSIIGERYNYFATVFISIFLTEAIFKLLKGKVAYILLLSICILLSSRTSFRILDWKNSETLFSSTVKSSKTFFKKGIWVYNQAISTKDETKKNKLLHDSINLLKQFLEENTNDKESNILKTYEIDNRSLKTKAAIRIATIYEMLGDRENQFKYLKFAEKLSNKQSSIASLLYKNLATYNFQENDILKAIDYYRKSISISPSPSIDYAIAVCYFKLGDLKNYELYLKKSTSIFKPDNISPFRSYGQLLESKKDFTGAEKHYKIATILENNVEPYFLLSLLYLRQVKIDNALEVVRNGLHSFPNSSKLTHLDGIIKISKGNIDEGSLELIKVINADESTKEIKLEACNILVDLFLRQNNIIQAKKYNELALKIDPQNKQAMYFEKILMVR